MNDTQSKIKTTFSSQIKIIFVELPATGLLQIAFVSPLYP